MSDIFYDNIEKSTINNDNYRNVQYTHPSGMQFVLMSIKPGEEIGMEVHKTHDQFFRIEKGKGELQIKKNNNIKKYDLYDGIGIIIPSGTLHNVINTGKDELKLYSIYTPPEHKHGLIQKEKPKIQEGGTVECQSLSHQRCDNLAITPPTSSALDGKKFYKFNNLIYY